MNWAQLVGCVSAQYALGGTFYVALHQLTRSPKDVN